jgi:beta-glucosidase-like glycosyl hydrolase
VVARAVALMKGLQHQGILLRENIFLGMEIPKRILHAYYSQFSKERLEVMEFYPYKQMFKEGLSSVMVAHLNVPSLESTKLSFFYFYNVVTTILKKELGF